jgi:hypothetical protein
MQQPVGIEGVTGADLLELKDAGRPFSWKVSSALAITLVFTNDSFFAEIADQVNGCSERDYVLEKKQAQEASGA